MIPLLFIAKKSAEVSDVFEGGELDDESGDIDEGEFEEQGMFMGV